MEAIVQKIKCLLVQPLLALAALASGSVPAFASTSSAPSLTHNLIYQNSGTVFVYFLNSVRSGTVPPCAANIGGTYYRLVFDSTTAGGKTMLAGLIAANEAGQQVWPDGTGDCGVDSSTESLLRFTTAD
jgi:hypothetical protein